MADVVDSTVSYCVVTVTRTAAPELKDDTSTKHGFPHSPGLVVEP